LGLWLLVFGFGLWIPCSANGYPSETTEPEGQSVKTKGRCTIRLRKMNKRTLIYGIIYGLCGGLLIAFLKYIEYRFIIVEHSVEIYGGLTAILFASLGIWLGLKLTRKKEVVIVKEVPVTFSEPFVLNESRVRELGITKRELEILELIARGLSNREIAEKLFVSENTVKTHSSRLLDKLSAKRRTQAVQIAKEMGLIR
jgi:DNA-binding CsgD family transcriptional regulator